MRALLGAAVAGLFGLGAVALAVPAMGTIPPPAMETVPDLDLGAAQSQVQATPEGSVLPGPPKLQGLPDEPSLRDVQLALRTGDESRALKLAERLVSQQKWGRDRHAAWMVVGLLHRDAKRHNLASEAFTRVRGATSSPLAELGMYYEAEQDLLRGKPAVAIRECQKYQQKYPEERGLYFNACSRIIAFGYADRGYFAKARELAEAYDEAHEKAPISEQIELALARWETEHDPKAAVRTVTRLWKEHRYALTGRVSQELLEELVSEDVPGAEIPTDSTSLKIRAMSLRDAYGYPDEAWGLYDTLRQRSADDKGLANWVEAAAEPFGWRTRRYDFLAERFEARYREKPDAKVAWNWYRALARAARWKEATDVGVMALKAHSNTRTWSRNRDSVARSLMVAGRYTEAREQYDILAKRGGWRGRLSRYYAGFCSHMAGEHEDAVKRLSVVIEADKSQLMEARYWRARAHEKLGHTELAEADKQWLRDTDPHHWYSLLLADGNLGTPDPARPTTMPMARNGSWPGALPPKLPDAPAAPAYAAAPVANPAAAPAPVATGSVLGLLGWPLRAAADVQLSAPVESVLRVDTTKPPRHYRDSLLFGELEAKKDFARFSRSHSKDFPRIGIAYELANAGLYDWSGPIFAQFFEDYRKAANNRFDPKHDAARKIRMRDPEWRALFLYVRDHNHSTRFTMGLETVVGDDEALQQEALRLQHPLAHSRYVWHFAEKEGLDPYLVEALMRQESIYNTVAVSRVGARGAMQIMPRTGHLLANLHHDVDFNAGELEDPVLAVERGVDYLGRLLERFDGVYTVAIASYNGGPHNLSRWLKGTGEDMPMDQFVEHIVFRETQNYVRRVSRRYSKYLHLYEDGVVLDIPDRADGDHPEVVDF